MLTRDEAFQQYDEEIDQIDKQAHEAKEKAKATLWEQLNSLRIEHHNELKAIRLLTQKTKGRVKRG